MTSPYTTNPDSREHESQADRGLSPEAIAAQGELHSAWNDTLYGSIEAPHVDGTTIAVEDLGQRIDQQKVSHGVDGDRHLQEHERQAKLNESALEVDIRAVQSGANEQLAKLGLADRAETTVTHRDAANETVAEVLVEGQGESGRLSFENQQDARDAAIATELDKALRRGEAEALQHLPASSAKKVTAWLGNIGEKYGAAEFAPNEDIAAVGAYIAFAEKVTGEAEDETIVRTDPVSGEIVAESLDDAIMRVLDGDLEAATLLNSEQYEKIKETQHIMEAQSGRFFSSKLDAEDQAMLVGQVRRALLTANAERMA